MVIVGPSNLELSKRVISERKFINQCPGPLMGIHGMRFDDAPKNEAWIPGCAATSWSWHWLPVVAATTARNELVVNLGPFMGTLWLHMSK